MQKGLHLIIKGRVQRVFFRQSTKNLAIQLCLTGFVRNLKDGDVEVVAEGEESKLLELLDWCRHGPEGAEVENIVINWLGAWGKHKDFSVLYTKF